MATDAPVTLEPRRRRWKRWMVVGVLVIAVASAWLILGEPPEVKLAQGVKFGMHENQVEEIIGPAGESGFSYSDANGKGTGLVRGRLRMRWYRLADVIEKKTGLALFDYDWDKWPVHIHFDKNVSCDRIKRGSEILVRPPKPKR